MEIDLVRKAETCACFVTVSAPKLKLLNAGLEMFSARKLQNGEVTGKYSRTLKYYDPSSRERK